MRLKAKKDVWIYYPDGSATTLMPMNGKIFTMCDMMRALGDNIVIVMLSKQEIIFFNGIYQLPEVWFNNRASIIARMQIFGPAVYVPRRNQYE